MLEPEESVGDVNDGGMGRKADHVYNRLKSMLVSQQISPHVPLEMKQIAEKFGVSITPVREALIILAHEGLISKGGYRSYVTRQLYVDEVEADYENAFMIAKFNLERFGKKLDLCNFVFEDIAGGINDPMSSEARALAHSLETLYQSIANLAENARLSRQMQDFNARTSLLRRLDFSHEGRAEHIAEDIRKVIELIRNKYIDEAINNMEQQLSKRMELIPGLVRESNLLALDAGDVFAVD